MRVGPNLSWAVTFSVGCWLAWKWRNARIQDPESLWTDKGAALILRTANSFAREVLTGPASVCGRRKEWKAVGWDKRDHWGVKLNTDGAAKGNPGWQV